MHVLIAGAGIAGCTLALSLQRLGIDFTLVEQAGEFNEVGAGIQLSPNGVKVLENVGLADRLQDFCVEPDAHLYQEWHSGRTLLRTTLMPQVREEYGAAYYHAHRADLIAALAAPLDAKRLRLNTTVTAAGQDDDKAWLDCADGTRLSGDLVIAADGIHSVIRDQLFDSSEPRRSGYVIWRGVVDVDAVPQLEMPVSSYIIMGPRMSFVCYYVSGGRKINWLAFGHTEDEKRESWSQTATKSEILDCFEGWYEMPVALVEATETPFVTALHDREPLASWIQGRIALTGDAAHAMLPYHAQGAVQGIEDAWVLARCLDLGRENIPRALLHYQDLRKDRTDRMVRHSRAGERWYHVDDPDDVAARNARFESYNEKFKGGFTPQQEWLYRYDAEKAALGTDDDWRGLPDW